MQEHDTFMAQAIELSEKAVAAQTGGPFGCVIVKDGKIVGRGQNLVTSTNDPTAHAEVSAIRDACKNLNTFQLEDCIVYTSCEPCPMCLGALYWARPQKVYFANSRHDAAEAGFDDSMIYAEIEKPLTERTLPIEKMNHPAAAAAFKQWKEKTEKIKY